MSMLKALFPDEVHRSVYTLSYRKLWNEGVRGLIFDIDNTLVPDNAPADDRCVRLFRALHGIGFKTCILSNNSEPRVRPFAEAVGSEFLCDVGKPAASGYMEALKQMQTGAENTVAFGDQLFTDIWGANGANIRSVLVRPVDPRERFHIRLKRMMEKPVLAAYRVRRRRLLRQRRKKS